MVAEEVLRALRKAQERERPASPALLDALTRAALSSLIAGKRAFSLAPSVELQELERRERRIGEDLDSGLKHVVRKRLPARLEAVATDGVTVDLDHTERIAAWREASWPRSGRTRPWPARFGRMLRDPRQVREALELAGRLNKEISEPQSVAVSLK